MLRQLWLLALPPPLHLILMCVKVHHQQTLLVTLLVASFLSASAAIQQDRSQSERHQTAVGQQQHAMQYGYAARASSAALPTRAVAHLCSCEFSSHMGIRDTTSIIACR